MKKTSGSKGYRRLYNGRVYMVNGVPFNYVDAINFLIVIKDNNLQVLITNQKKESHEKKV